MTWFLSSDYPSVIILPSLSLLLSSYPSVIFFLLPAENPRWIKRAQPFLPKPHKVPLNQYLRGLLTPTNKHNSPLLPKSQSALISTHKFLYHLSSLFWGHHSSVCASLSPRPALSKRLVSRALKWVTVATYRILPDGQESCSLGALLGSSRAKDALSHGCVDTRAATLPTLQECCEMPQTTAL